MSPLEICSLPRKAMRVNQVVPLQSPEAGTVALVAHRSCWLVDVTKAVYPKFDNPALFNNALTAVAFAVLLIM